MSRRFDRGHQFTATDRLPYIVGTSDQPVELAALDVQVLVTGLFAETTQTLRLHNPNHRDLEGELVFPLPDGAVVCGYAIDVGGQLVDGVVVAKEEARRILEAEIRKGVDPGLIEQVQGNVYRTRIYPLPAGGSRTIKIVYVSRLTTKENDAAYHLPLGHADGVESVALRVEVSQTPVEPALVGGLGNLSMTHFESRWVAEATLSNGTPDDLQIRLPNLPDHLTAVERFGDDDFFCISSRVQADREPKAWNPERVAVLWDASGSRESLDRELDLIAALAQRWQDVTFDVQVVRDVVESARAFDVRAGDCADLVDFLRQLPCDGGTNLAALDLSSLPHEGDEAWLLFSDGLNTIGTGVPFGTSNRVFTVSAQPQIDSALLSYVATRSGGTHFNLLRIDPASVAETIGSWGDSLRLVDAAGCTDVHVSVEAGRLTIVGRLIEPIGSVRLTGPGAPSDHLAVTKGTATTGRNLARAWAGEQAQLERMLGAEPQVFVELGQTFGLVTPGTSLLVLETLEQYLEYDIEPPVTLPAMREQFLANRRQFEHDTAREEASQIESVVSMWQARLQWFDTDYAGSHKKRKLQSKSELRDDDDETEDMGLSISFEGAPPSGAYGGEPMAQAAAAPAPAPMEPQMRARSAPDRMAEEEMEIDAFDGADEMMSLSAEDVGEGGDVIAKEIGGSSSAQASIQIKPWSPDTPYLNAMKAVGLTAAYDTYLQNRAEFALSPAFFLDCADYLLANEQRNLGLRVLSNLLELALDDPPLLRMYAWRMQQAGEFDQAISILERVLAKRDDEPQSHRDLALALEQRWQRDGDPEDAVRAMDLLYAVIKRTWDRFPEIELIALVELNRLIHLASQADIVVPAEFDRRLIRLLDLDVRISMSWDADLTDVDLHVFEPTGEHAYYGHNRTEIGGLVSRDFTQGYGPEEYVLRVAEPGDYTIKTHYYGSHQQTIAGACTVIVTVFTNYARADEHKQVLTLRLEQASDQVVVGTITIDPGSVSTPTADWQQRFRGLDKGMTVDQVVAILGQPGELRGADETVLIYRPVPGVEVHVRAAPRVHAVQQHMDGAVLDLI